MPEEMDIRTMIDEDIDRVERVWEASSYDSDALEELFRLLLEHYAERIEGFTKRLKVIQPYEDIADMAENYRENVQTLLERMKLFRENGYSNEGLIEYSIAKEREELNFNADFTTVRLEIGMMQGRISWCIWMPWRPSARRLRPKRNAGKCSESIWSGFPGRM